MFMIEITRGTLDERIIKLLQKKYPITIDEISHELKLKKDIVTRVLQKFQIKGIVQLEPLPGKTFVRLIRKDFSFIGKKHQKKFIKHHKNGKKQETEEYNGIMYS